MKYKILIPVDFSDVTFPQMEAARAFCQSGNAEIELLHIHNPVPGYMGSGESGDGLEPSEQRRLMDLTLRNLDSLLVGLDCKTRGNLLQGNSVPRILHEVESSNPDLLIIGSHGHGALYNMLVGSVARGIISKCDVPILVVPADGESLPKQLGRVTVGIDFGTRSEELLQASARIARQVGAVLHIFHVIPPPQPVVDGLAADYMTADALKAIKEDARAKLEKLAGNLSNEENNIEFEVQVDSLSGGLINASEEPATDLLILGSHGHGLTFDLLVGSVTQKAIQMADRPVMLIPIHKRIPFDIQTTEEDTE